MDKVFTLISSMALCAMTAGAQISGNPIVSFPDEVGLRFIPSEYATVGSTSVLYSLEERVSQWSAAIYNSDFKREQIFDLQGQYYKLEVKRYTKLKDVTASVAQLNLEVMTNGDGPLAVAAMNRHQMSYDGMSYEVALEQFKNMTGTDVTVEKKDADTYLYAVGRYFEQDRYGTKYPMLYGVWSPVPSADNGTLTVYEVYYGEVATFSKEAATAICAEQGYRPMMVDDKTCFFPPVDNEYDYFMYSRFGYRYPRRLFYLNGDGVLTRYNVEYRADAQMAEDWILERAYSEDSDNLRPVSVTPVMFKMGGVDMDAVYISNTMFRNWNSSYLQYDYVFPITEVYEEESIDHEYIDGLGDYEVKTVRQWDRVVGYRVMDAQSHQEVAKLTLPDGFESDTYLDLIDFGDKRYIAVEAQKKENNDARTYRTFVYKIDPNASGVMELVEDQIEMTVMPRLARRSTPITVNFGSEGKSPRKVIVTSVSGMTVMTKDVAAGETSTSIDTSAFGQGMYVVSVVENGRKSEHCKVIIR